MVVAKRFDGAHLSKSDVCNAQLTALSNLCEPSSLATANSGAQAAVDLRPSFCGSTCARPEFGGRGRNATVVVTRQQVNPKAPAPRFFYRLHVHLSSASP